MLAHSLDMKANDLFVFLQTWGCPCCTLAVRVTGMHKTKAEVLANAEIVAVAIFREGAAFCTLD